MTHHHNHLGTEHTITSFNLLITIEATLFLLAGLLFFLRLTILRNAIRSHFGNYDAFAESSHACCALAMLGMLLPSVYRGIPNAMWGLLLTFIAAGYALRAIGFTKTHHAEPRAWDVFHVVMFAGMALMYFAHEELHTQKLPVWVIALAAMLYGAMGVYFTITTTLRIVAGTEPWWNVHVGTAHAVFGFAMAGMFLWPRLFMMH